MITALIVQDYFGGEILEAAMRRTVNGKRYLLKHFWNQLPDEQEIDFTRDQFPEGTIIPKGEKRTRVSLLRTQHVRDRYRLLKSRVNKLIRNY